LGGASECGAGEEDDDLGREVGLGVVAIGLWNGGEGELVDFEVNGLLAGGETLDVVAREGAGCVVGEKEGGDLPVEVGVGGFGHGERRIVTKRQSHKERR